MIGTILTAAAIIVAVPCWLVAAGMAVRWAWRTSMYARQLILEAEVLSGLSGDS